MILLFATTVFTANQAHAQWTNEYQYELYGRGEVYWFDSSNALVDDWLITEYGAKGTQFVAIARLLPINSSLFLAIDESAYKYYDKAGNVVGSTLYATAQDTGDKAIIEAFGLYIHASCWMHLIRRKNGDVSGRISYDKGASWHDTEVPALDFSWSLYYICTEKFTLRQVDSSIWIYSGFTPDTLFHSIDLGKTWEKIALPVWLNPTVYEMMAFSSKNDGLMTCFNPDGLAKTTDGGNTWSLESVAKPIKQNTRIIYAKGTANKEGFYVVYGPKGCHYSTSEGQWWALMDSSQHSYISFYNAEAGFSFYPGPNFPYADMRTFSNRLMTSWKPSVSEKALIYPNPARGFLYTESSESTPVIIVNSLGTEVYRSAVFSQDAPLDIRSLEPGSYMLYLPASGRHILVIKH